MLSKIKFRVGFVMGQNYSCDTVPTTCFLSAGQSKCEAASLKLGRWTAVAALLQQLPAAVVLRSSEIINISPSLRSGEIRHYFCAADYLRLPKFSLTNRYIFRENTQFFTKIVVDGSGDRTTSEESWLHLKTQTGFTDTPGLTLTPKTLKSLW